MNRIIGEKIRQIIASSPYSTKEVAEHIGMSHQNLYRIFRKDSVETKYVEKLADLMAVPLSYFFTDQSITYLKNSPTVQNSGEIISLNNMKGNYTGKSNESTMEAILKERIKGLENQIDSLRTIIQEKDKIIALLSQSEG